MFRYKSNKQAFIIAISIILLCLICLVGSTLALFTNDPNDGTIGVVTTSGNIKVDIVDESGNSLKGEELQFITYSGHSDPKFEPGAAFYTQGFKIKNDGNIPINFRLSVTEAQDESMIDFYDAFEVWISKNPDDLTDAKRDTAFQGSVGPESIDEETYYLYVKMKESAGEKFQGRIYSGIGITVIAVQGNVEIVE